jgi:signal transduction histidine kinase
LVSNLRDLVWTINPKQDSFETILDRLNQYGTEICAARHISFTAVCDDAMLKKILHIDARHEIYLFLKEAINNAVKHSGATSVILSFSETDDYLEFSVRDNGSGFNPATIRKGNGLITMQARADEIGATLVQQTGEGYGTFVSMQYKIT